MNSLPRFVSILSALIPTVWLVGCQSVEKSSVSINYYKISGNSTAALDSEIKRKGPKISGGNHAVAIARIKMFPKVDYDKVPSGCRISSARISVDAKVTLPKWTGRKTASQKLGEAWDSIDRYTRHHEATHVDMAFSYARKMERKLLKIGTQPNCEKVRTEAKKVIDQYLKAHDKAQRKFDADEQARFSKLARKHKIAETL